MNHRAGYVNLIGRPNAGKSTLMNALVGERLAIISHKAQTTRHRILGIVNGDDFQVVISDTPGILKPAYELHKAMMAQVRTALDDADVLIALHDPTAPDNEGIYELIPKAAGEVYLTLNKVDKVTEDDIAAFRELAARQAPKARIFEISALSGDGVPELFKAVVDAMPEHPPYFDKDALTDRPERFFVSEIIREQIFHLYEDEIPYASEVIIEAYQEDEDIIRMRAEIYVERNSQKAIIIGKKGASIKEVGIRARKQMEAFLGKRVYLELYVRVEEKWRRSTSQLRRFGYRE